jgi:SpoVK/Ycf46/Vps4 family AAA+-type ATPase
MDKFLFDDIIEYPDSESWEKYDSLVGLDDVKNRIIKESEIMLNPTLLSNWSTEKYGKIVPLIKIFNSRHSLFIISGDVGTGKTTLAESFGDELARRNKYQITLFSLSLGVRGTGAAGDMTRYMAQAFQEVRTHALQLKNPDGNFTSASILLIDEADALVESRDTVLMYHEDKAGVNGLLQGVDMIAKLHLPVIIVFCTNREESIDSAIKRRAASIFKLKRPTEEQRFFVFQKYLTGTGISEDDMHNLARLTGENDKRKYGYTYSDLIRKVLTSLVLESLPSEQVTMDKIVQMLDRVEPTPPLISKI